MLDRQNDPEISTADGPEAAPKEAPAQYRVGYGRPPSEKRFKPGRSGNPTGQPKGSRNAKSIVGQVVNEKISIRENGRTRKVTKLEAMLQAATVKAIKGDTRALNTMLAFLARAGQLTEPEADGPATSLPEDDDAIIRDFLRRQTDGSEEE